MVFRIFSTENQVPSDINRDTITTASITADTITADTITADTISKLEAPGRKYTAILKTPVEWKTLATLGRVFLNSTSDLNAATDATSTGLYKLPVEAKIVTMDVKSQSQFTGTFEIATHKFTFPVPALALATKEFSLGSGITDAKTFGSNGGARFGPNTPVFLGSSSGGASQIASTPITEEVGLVIYNTAGAANVSTGEMTIAIEYFA
jgi:hypothetical protein